MVSLSARLTRAARVCSGVLLVGLLALLVTLVLVPRLVGGSTYTVLTGSMRPAMPPGSVVVVRPISAGDVRPGSVITYQVEPGRPQVRTHRVVAVQDDPGGSQAFWTQGDANPSPDPDPVRPVQVRGEVWFSVPYVGWAGQLLAPGVRVWAVRGLAAGLFGYALLMWGLALAEARRDLGVEGWLPVGRRVRHG